MSSQDVGHSLPTAWLAYTRDSRERLQYTRDGRIMNTEMGKLLFPERDYVGSREKKSGGKGGPHRRIILCFDGTGNQFSDTNSNVLQLFKCLRKDDPNQIVYYQTGMGTYTHPWLTTKLAVNLSMKWDAAIAWNLEHHVEDAYRFLMQTYQHGDKISLFGFSRGAYVARVLAGFLQKIGLLPRENIAQIPFAWNVFKKSDSDVGPQNYAEYKKSFCISVQIDFMGLWDTVAALGISGRELPFATPEVHDYIRVFRHALALDERRAKFKPNFKLPLRHVSNSANGANQGTDGRAGSIKTQDTLEVWFAGCHCDIGGGSVKEKSPHSLARIPLRWMIRECFVAETGIVFDAEMLGEIGFERMANKASNEPGNERGNDGTPETIDMTMHATKVFKNFFEETYPASTPPRNYKSPSIVAAFVGFICATIQLLAQGSWRILKYTLRFLSSPVRYTWYIIKNTTFVKHLRARAYRRVQDDLEGQPNGPSVHRPSSANDQGGGSDVFSPIYDQLSIVWPWWIFEVWPLVSRLQDSQKRNREEHETHINMGRGREIYGDAWNREGEKQFVNVHRSVFVRMKGSDYRPRPWFFLDAENNGNIRNRRKFNWLRVFNDSTKESDLTGEGWDQIRWVD